MDERSIARIQVGPRIRQDLGNIGALADSIRTYGLLHPLVIDDAGHLIAGHRRLEAVKQLGWDTVPVCAFGSLTPHERRWIELEENIRRKDLTEAERSIKIVELAETAKAVVEEETQSQGRKDREEQLRAESARNSKRGRRPESGSYRDIAQRTGIPEPTIRQAEQHVAAMAAHPEVEATAQVVALEYARTLKEFPWLDIAKARQVPPEKVVEWGRALRKAPHEEQASMREALEGTIRVWGDPTPWQDPVYLAHQAAGRAFDYLEKAALGLAKAGDPEGVLQEEAALHNLALGHWERTLDRLVPLLQTWQRAIDKQRGVRRIR